MPPASSARRPLLALLLLLPALACSSPDGATLFAKGDAASVASGAAGGSAAAMAGTGSSGGLEQTPEQGGSVASSGGTDSGGTDGGSSQAGTTGAGGAQAGSSSSGGSAGQAMQPIVIESCDMLEGAVSNEANGHCYRVNADLLTFAAAKDACQANGGHLITVTSKDEDEFAHQLLGESHWLGAADGRGDREPGVGDYTWVNGEPWDYTNWDGGQPNAVATNCADENSGSHCYEHCAYQSAAGGWIDRACFHTIASICEWELPTQ